MSSARNQWWDQIFFKLNLLVDNNYACLLFSVVPFTLFWLGLSEPSDCATVRRISWSALFWNSSRAPLDQLRGTTKDSFRMTSQPARWDLNLEPPEYMPVPLPGWALKWQDFELKFVGVLGTSKCDQLHSSWEHGQETPHLLRNTQVICRDDRKQSRHFADLYPGHAVFESRFRRRNILHGIDIVFIRRILLHFKTQLCGRIFCSNGGESRKFRVGNMYCRCCENDLTWSGAKLK